MWFFRAFFLVLKFRAQKRVIFQNVIFFKTFIFEHYLEATPIFFSFLHFFDFKTFFLSTELVGFWGSWVLAFLVLNFHFLGHFSYVLMRRKFGKTVILFHFWRFWDFFGFFHFFFAKFCDFRWVHDFNLIYLYQNKKKVVFFQKKTTFSKKGPFFGTFESGKWGFLFIYFLAH